MESDTHKKSEPSGSLSCAGPQGPAGSKLQNYNTKQNRSERKVEVTKKRNRTLYGSA